jgi:nucleoside-diphosphate-sugar epimerase
MRAERPVIFGDGEQSRDFTYVANVVRANVLAMDASDVAGKVFNVACGERVTLNQLVRELRDLLGSEVDPIHADPRPGDIKHSHADLSLARTELGYEPEVHLRDGLMFTIQHFQDELAACEHDVVGSYDR